MAINNQLCDHIIDSIDRLIDEVLEDLDHDAKLYVLNGLSDVVSNAQFDLTEVTA
jgi:hypothetical protein